MAPHSSTLAWKIPRTEEPGRLQSMGSLRVRHNWATSLSRIGEGNGNPLQCSCLENPRGGEAWWAAVYGAAQSRTQLKQLSSSSRTFLSLVLCLLELCFWHWHFLVAPTPLFFFFFLRKKKRYVGSGGLNHFIPPGLITFSFFTSLEGLSYLYTSTPYCLVC